MKWWRYRQEGLTTILSLWWQSLSPETVLILSISVLYVPFISRWDEVISMNKEYIRHRIYLGAWEKSNIGCLRLTSTMIIQSLQYNERLNWTHVNYKGLNITWNVNKTDCGPTVRPILCKNITLHGTSHDALQKWYFIKSREGDGLTLDIIWTRSRIISTKSRAIT